jgi:uncharacterized iron-regulated membrane protein
VRRLHFYAAIFVGPFILVAAVSGALYSLTPQIEKIVYAHELYVPESDTQLPLAVQIEAAEDYIGPDETLTAVRPAPAPGQTTRVMYAGEDLGDSESRAIFIDPSTAEVRGDLTVYGTSGALPLRTWVDQLHRSLHLGDVGRLYSELAASWLGVIAVAGVCLWVIRARKSRRAAQLLRPSLAGAPWTPPSAGNPLRQANMPTTTAVTPRRPDPPTIAPTPPTSMRSWQSHRG